MDLIKILGPYGKRFANSPNSARAPQLDVIPNSSRKNTGRRSTRLSASNRGKFHKKTNITFLRDGQGRVADRLFDIEKRQKDRRAELVMENRMPSSNYPNVADPKLATRAKTSKANVAVSVSTDSEKQVTNARAEQLARWKREKEELNKQKMAIKKPPFKGGAGIVVPGQVRPGSAVSATRSATASKSGLTAGVPPPAPLTERRVTRAMAATAKSSSSTTSKTNVNANFTSTTNRSKNTAISKPSPRDFAPAASTMSLATGKNANSLLKKKVPEVILYLAKDAPINTEQPENNRADVKFVSVEVKHETKDEPRIPFMKNSDLNNGNGQRALRTPARAPAVTPVKVETQAKVPPKKKKGMQFDSVYMEFNDVFIKTCSSLMEYSKQWTKILAETPNIPEEIIEDIQSTLGQGQLLMESKLPQFGELLYFYLSRHQDPGPVLPCDLQGWWDVATISIQNVKNRFENLNVLSNNNWVKAKPIAVKRSRLAIPVPQKQSNNTEPAKEKPPKASAGLRAFLAGKRKKVDVDVEVQPTVEPVPETALSKLDAIQFEGGFFTIDSPVRTPVRTVSSASLFRVTGSHALHSDPRINRRQSSSNTSLRMLAVRSSMGSICKIGVEAGSYAPEVSPTSLNLKDSDK